MISASSPTAPGVVGPRGRGRPRPWPEIDRPLLLSRFEAVVADGGSVLMVGPTGAGRTTLLRQLGDALPATPARLAGADVTDDDLAVTLDHVPGVRLVLPDRGRPVVLLDDAHRLPAGTTDQLAGLVARHRIRLIATLDPAAAARAPWLRLWREGPAERVDLPPLTPEETADLLRLALASPISAITVQQLRTASGGFPFYLRELVRGMQESGVLQRREGCWVETGPATPGRRLVDVARHELGRLTPAGREALQLLSLTEPLPLGRLVDVVGEDTVEQLRADGLVTVDHLNPGPGRHVLDARIVPPVLADAVRETVPPARRRDLLARLDLAPPVPSRPDGVLRTLLSAVECGTTQPPELVLAAMGTALSLERPDLTLRLGEAVVEGIERPDVAAAARLLCAGAWRLLDRPAPTARELSLVRNLVAAPLPAATRRTLALRLVEAEESLLFHTGDTDGALALLGRFAEEVDGDAATSGFVRLARLERLGRAGRHAEALPGSLAVLQGGTVPVRALRLVPSTVIGLAEHGRFEESLDLLRRHGTALESRTDVPWLTTELDAAGVLAHVWAGDVDGAGEYLEGGEAPRTEHRPATGDLCEALLASARGLWSQADRAWACAAARLAGADPAGSVVFVLAGQAMAAAALGESARAAGLAARTVGLPLRAAAAAESQVRLFLLDAALWSRAVGVGSRAREVAAWARAHGLVRAELEALHRVGFVVHGEGGRIGSAVLDRMETLAEGMSPVPRTAALLAHARAMAAADHPFVAVTARELGRVGVWLPAAASGAGLTRREQEIAGLAASGLSSKEIGRRLTLSVRTVDSHLSRVFTKLGVRSRVELGAVIPSSAAPVTAGRRTS